MRSSNVPATPSTSIQDAPAAGELHAIALCDVSVVYGRRPALEHVTLDLPHGRVISVIGPNGSGKSTLLKAIAGLVPLTGGCMASARAIATRCCWPPES